LMYIKTFIIMLILLLGMNMRITVQGIEESQAEKPDYSRVGSKIENTVRGSIEDQSWMTSVSKQEVHSLLKRYFAGNLLEDLTEKCWDFIKEPTDWYSEAKVIDMKVLYNDGKRAVVEALIRIEDVDTGHNEIGKGLFTMNSAGDQWRINYMAIQWGMQSEIR